MEVVFALDAGSRSFPARTPFSSHQLQTELRFADTPSARVLLMARLVVLCMFMQGASGDLSAMSTEQTRGIEAFGKAMSTQVTEVAGSENVFLRRL
jgi:hypothetical protein